MIEAGKAKTLASLGHNTDGIPSGPDERVCLALSKVLRTEGTEKLAVSGTGASHTGASLLSRECTTGVKTDEK